MQEIVVSMSGAGEGGHVDPALYEQVREIIDDGTADNTRRAYRSDLRYIAAWAYHSGRNPDFPMHRDAVIAFIAEHLAGLPDDLDELLVDLGIKGKPGPHAISTIERRIYALSVFHRSKELPNPVDDQRVKDFLMKARKAAVRRGYRPSKKRAATKDIVDRLALTCDFDARGHRDRAMILFGFSSGGRRRSEIADANIEDLVEVEGGYIYSLGKSKTNQDGRGGREVAVLGEAGDALRSWLALVRDTKGPIFRRLSPQGFIQKSGISDKTVARIVKERAQQAGLDPALFAGHSLRSGFITEGGKQNLNIFNLMEMSGHTSMQTARGYFQAGAALHNPAARLFG
ncbi:site-specific integrase [Tranquillimonas alkanivorans]|uniref:Site-specific recombinase XerD n=1 Tax=Tranquillimonas alkanivorans TaxID=441119 RepID=A0A1I5W351_9RHOB|nr:site-specific integrase [Tranquillimonas alkanivorans]SFQ14113.1 Site-specific recombinase XerD [Tranquillimonas alkanivorans]